MTDFTPFTAMIGGGLIGLAAFVLLIFNGRIAGISGIVNNLIFSNERYRWQFLFVIGLIISPIISTSLGFQLPSTISAPWYVIIIAGFAVGFGAKLGSGCTSGHGICGIGRLSLRSVIATCLFMLSGIITVYITQHLI